MNKKLVLLSACMLTAGSITAQKRVTGHVVDGNGDPIVGAVVKVQGTKIFTRTDDKGNFTLPNVPPTAKKLLVSYVGMKSQNVSIAGNVNVVLKDNQIEGAVVVGYGTAKKLGTVVGTVTKVSGDKIENKPVTTALDALQGKVAGVQIVNATGDVGSIGGVSATIRGRGSLNGGNTPLYVVDGQPVDPSVFYMLNPNDIASYSVLRDASATSIYGARASNGVIFVTTKQGKAGEKAQIKFGQSIGWASLARRIGNPMSTNEFLNYLFENGAIDGPDYVKYKMSNINTDWQKYYFKKSAPMYNTEFSISGAGPRTTYYVSASYMKKLGLTPSSKFKRYTTRVNLATQATDWLKFGLNLGLNYSERQTDGMVGALYKGNNPGMSSVTNVPFISPYGPNGSRLERVPYINFFDNEIWAKYNPLDRNDARLTGSAYVELTPIQGLTIKSQFGTDLYDYRSTIKSFPSAPYNDSPDQGSRSESFSRNGNFTITNTAEYKWDVNDDHQLTFLLGQEGIKYTSSGFNASGNGMSDDRLMNLQNSKKVTPSSDLGSSRSETQYLSYFGRIDYSFLRKYYLNLTLRNDKAARFGAKNRSATFASGGFMWNMTEEKFIKDITWINDLRFKASVGSTGNSQGIGYYDSYARIATGLYNGEVSSYLGTPGNDKLGWEKQIQTTVGFSSRIFDRANIEFNFYNRLTKDMLMDVPVPFTTGFSTQTLNVASMVNRGIELQFDVDAVKDWNGLNVNLYGNFTYNLNKITKLFYGIDKWDMTGALISYRVGKPITYYMPINAGVDPKNGKTMWYVPDANGEPTSKTTEEFDESGLIANTGKTQVPPINGGFGLTASWRGLSLSADFSFVLGKWMVDNIDIFTLGHEFSTANKDRRLIGNYWRKPGDVKKYPAFTEKKQFDSQMLYNSSYLRLKNLSLAYDLPERWVKATGFVQNIRLSATARNLLTVTKFPGSDPEIQTNILQANEIPNTREFALGVEFTF